MLHASPTLDAIAPETTWGEARLVAAGALADAVATATPTLDADVLLGLVVGVGRASLLAHLERLLTTGQAESYRALIARRLAGEPVAYLTGHREFMGLDLLADPRALIPRPETELLVEAALAEARARLGRGAVPLVADIGTGSGAIALALAALEPRLPRVYATDASPAALALAGENARRLGVAGRVVTLLGDLLAPLPEPVDLLLANLPYISPADAASLPPDVRCYEPAAALYGADDGLGHFRRLFAMLDGRGAVARLRAGATLYLEIGYDQRPAVEALARRHLPGARVRTLADYAGWERVFVVETGPAPP
jgi:release factor glutamine methyltransferase